MRPLRVTYVIAALVAGGAERQLALLLEHVDRREIEPRVIAFEGGRWQGSFEALGVPVVIIPYRAGRLTTLVRTARLLRRWRPHVVHTYGHSANYVGRMAALIARVPIIVVSERSAPYIKSAFLLWVDRCLGRWTACLVANSAHAARFYIDHHILDAANVEVVRNGIRMPAATRQARGAQHIVTIGDFRPEKGCSVLFAAFVLLRSSMPDVRLHLVGEGPGRAAAESEAVELGIADRVTFHGYVDDVAGLLAQLADVYVHTARYEGSPNAVIEAMACGVPCVAFDAPWTPELLASGERGVAVTMGDVHALADAMRGVLAEPAAVEDMVARAQEFVRSELSVAAMVETTVGIYRGLIGEPAMGSAR